MRKTILYIILLLMFIFPNMAKAETITLDICEDGCEYASIQDAAMYITSKEGTNHEVIIDLHGDTHELGQVPFQFGDKISKLTFNGNNATINVSNYVRVDDIDNVEMNNITINAGGEFGIEAQKATFNNCHISSQEEITLAGKDFEALLNNADIINNRSYIDNIFIIKDSTFEGFFDSIGNKITFDNSTINNGFLCAMADCYFENSTVKGGIISGFYPGTNVYIKTGNTLEKPISRNYINNLDDDGEILMNYIGQNGSLNETLFMDIGLENISRDLTNNVFYYQEISKTIKTETNLSVFESEFVNTYENSEGYDEIKDLPITWKSENESVATIKDGKIIPGNADNTDLIGKRGNDIYTIHLNVEKETLPEKIGNLIEKKTIKVPITGKEVKLWIVIVVASSLIIIGCSILLIIKKRKKKTTK